MKYGDSFYEIIVMFIENILILDSVEFIFFHDYNISSFSYWN